MSLNKAGGNWVEADSFFDRELELQALEERVRQGNHTLLTAQRRMGKTSLVRELLRRLSDTGQFDTVFVDLEAAGDPADGVAEIAVQSKPVRGAWRAIRAGFANVLREASDRIEELAIADVRVKLRAGIDAGNWRQRGDAVFAALAANQRPIVLAIDELPILVNRLLKDDDGRIAPAGKQATDEFLSWLRKNGQGHRGRVSLIMCGSVGLEPLLGQAGLGAHTNIFAPYDLKPWSEDTAVSCLGALAATNEIDLSVEVRRQMCRRLRCCIPHHVQMFFDKVHEQLRHAERHYAWLDDIEWVYRHEMLSVRGQADLQHYESRLRTILGPTGYPVALEILTETAVSGRLDDDGADQYRALFSNREEDTGAGVVSMDDVLHVLRHDGYLERQQGGYRFVSGLLEDWWRSRYGENFVSVLRGRRQDGGTTR